MAISEAMGREVAKRLAEAQPAKRRGIVQEYVKCTGHTEQHIYSVARKHGWKSGRKKKATAGERKIEATDDQLESIAKIIDECRVKGTAPVPTWRAIQIAEDSGYISRGSVSPSFFNGWFKTEGYSRKKKDCRERKNHIHLASLHPNHVHLVDITNCTQWYLEKDGTLGHQGHKEVYRNKEGKNPKGKKILRFMLVDHFSNTFFPYYFLTDGEGALETRDFLIKGWRKKRDPGRYPFHGVPLILMGDKGPGNESTLVQGTLSSLGVEWISHGKGKPWVKGAVEGMMAIWERAFESCLRLDPVYSVEDLNARAYDMAIFMNTKKTHKRLRGPRFGAWNTIKKDQLRILPDDDVLSTLVQTRALDRTVGPDLMIRLDGGNYRVPDPDLNGARVSVCYDPYNPPDILVTAGDKHYRLSRIGEIEGNFLETAAIIGKEYKTAPQQTGAKKQNALKEKEWIASPRAFGEGVKNVGSVGYIDRKGTPFDVVPLIREVAKISAMTQIKAKLGRGLTVEENRYIHATYQRTVPEMDIRAMVERFRGQGSGIMGQGGAVSHAVS